MITWACILIFAVLGGLGLYFSLQAPDEKIELARKLRHVSLICWALAAGIYVIKRAVKSFLA